MHLTLRHRLRSVGRYVRYHWQLYAILAVPVVYILIFNYYPMYGVQLAFKNFQAVKGIAGSPWVGLANFRKFFAMPNFWNILWNTFSLSAYGLVAGFPFPIILALLLNMCLNKRYKKVVQTVTYMPFFISTVVMVGMLLKFLDLRNGIINNIIAALGGPRTPFMNIANMWQSIYVWSGVWQGTGFGSIIYLAVLSGVDPTYHEAAVVDGASRFRRLIHIDLPAVIPTTVILTILSLGGLLNVGFEKAFLMQNSLNVQVSQIISTYVYNVSLGSSVPQFAYATAVGLFNSVISIILLVSFNFVARRIGDTSLF